MEVLVHGYARFVSAYVPTLSRNDASEYYCDVHLLSVKRYLLQVRIFWWKTYLDRLPK